MKFFSLFLLLTLCNVLSSQNSKGVINGTVVSGSSAENIIGANVYLSNTMIGTTTDKEGYFQILNVPAGRYKLVVSIIGYDSYEENIIVENNQTLRCKINLKEITYELDEVIVKSEIPEEWYKNLRIFERHFLGQTDYTNLCEIENPEIIELNKKNSTLYASAKTPIVVINKALGYKIVCNLKTFYYDEQTLKSHLEAGFFFSELKTNDLEQSLIWKNNRESTYNSSITNFLLWVGDDSAGNSQFELYYINRLPLGQIQPVKKFLTDKKFLRIDADSPNGYKLDFEEYLSVKSNVSGAQSYIKLLHEKVTINEYGYPEESKPFEVYGNWGVQGLANQLPKYFKISDN